MKAQPANSGKSSGKNRVEKEMLIAKTVGTVEVDVVECESKRRFQGFLLSQCCLHRTVKQ